MRFAPLLAVVLLVAMALPALAAEPEDTVLRHFAAIQAQDYVGAAKYFSAAYRRAFRDNVKAQDRYYSMRRLQLAAGYTVVAVERLADNGKETARVTVDFHDPQPDAPVTSTERMHYYLIREKAENGEPLRDSGGQAWRIDIYDALSYSALAEARRRPYLYTSEAWAEDEGRELKAEQGLYRVQQALENYFEANGHYPLRLLGEENRRDELIAGGYLPERYPSCGFNERPMRSVGLSERSSGDFTYVGAEPRSNGNPTKYYLVLHGKVRERFLFRDTDSILILGSGYRVDQENLATELMQHWFKTEGEQLMAGPGLGEMQVMSQTVASAESTEVAPAVDTGPPLTDPAEPVSATTGAPPAGAQPLEPVPPAPVSPESMPTESVPTEAAPSDTQASTPTLPGHTWREELQLVALVVHAWGF